MGEETDEVEAGEEPDQFDADPDRDGAHGDPDEFEDAVEAGLLAEFGCAERDAERVAAVAARARAAGDLPDWSPSFVAEKLADAPDRPSVTAKWNWLLGYLGGDADSDEYRLDG